MIIWFSGSNGRQYLVYDALMQDGAVKFRSRTLLIGYPHRAVLSSAGVIPL